MAIAQLTNWRMALATLFGLGLLGLAGFAVAGGAAGEDAPQDSAQTELDESGPNDDTAEATEDSIADAESSENAVAEEEAPADDPSPAPAENEAHASPPDQQPQPRDVSGDPTRRFRDRVEAQRRANARRPGHHAPMATPTSQPNGMSLDAHKLPDVSEDELDALRQRIRSSRSAQSDTPASTEQPEAAAEPRTGRPISDLPPELRPTPEEPSPVAPSETDAPAEQPDSAGTEPPPPSPDAATPRPTRPGSPGSAVRPRGPTPPVRPTRPEPRTPSIPPPTSGSGPEAYRVRTNEQTKQPEFVRPVDHFRLPVEDRKFFFVWKDTPLPKTLEDFVEMSGLPVIGEFDAADAQQKITFESVQMQDFDDALTTYNNLLMEKGYWVLRMDQYLGVRRLTDWYRYIPAARMYKSVEAYEEAKLPEWDLASVRYEPKFVSASMLAQTLMDLVPDNSARVTLVPDSNKIEMRGFVAYINRQLELTRGLDEEGTDGREWRAYPLKYAAPSVALEMLSELLPPSSDGASVARTPRPTPAVRRPGQPRTATPTPTTPEDIGTSTAEDVEIREDKRRNQLLVRASEAKHKLVEEYIQEFIDVPLVPPERREVIKLEYVDPAELVEKITPLLGRRELYQPPAPPPRPGPGGTQVEQPAPPPQFRSIGSTAVLVPMETSRSVLVKATEDEMAQIKEYIAMLDIEAPDDAGKLQYVTLSHGSATNIASVVSTVFGQRTTYRPGSRSSVSEGLRVVPDSVSDKAIVLSGENRRDMDAAKKLIQQLDVDPMAGAVEHVVVLEGAVPSVLAETLSSRFSQSGGGSSRYSRGYYGGGGGDQQTLPRFLADDTSKMLIVLCRSETWPDIERLIKQVDERNTVSTLTRTYRLKYADAAMMTNLLNESLSSRSGGAGGRRGYYYGASLDPNAPAFIYEPQSNAVVVTALEEIHTKAQELIDEIDRPSPADEATWRSIALAKADVEYVREVLEDVFETSGGGRRSRYGGYYGGYGSYGRSSGDSSNKIPVRIIAETVSNRLLVSASDEDFAKIEELAKQIDADYEAKEIVRRTFEMKFAEPGEVSEIIQTTFEARTTGRSGRWGGMSSEGPNLGVKVSEIGRGIIVQAPKDKMEEIAALIEEVDTDATAGNEIRTYKVRNADYRGTYELANNLRQIFTPATAGRGGSSSSNLRFIGEYGSDLLLVSAPTHRMEEIDKMVNEMIEAKAGADLTMTIRHFDIRRARPQEIADIIEPVLTAKYQELQQQSGGGRSYYGWGGSGGPRITAHKGENRIMVSAPSTLMETVEELIAEFDRPSTPSTTRIISLVTGKADEIAPIVQDQMAAREGSTSGRSRRAYDRGWNPWSSWGRTSSSDDGDELTVTPVTSNNSIILTGAEQKVAEAEELVKKLDDGARPEGMFQVIRVENADLREVADLIEDIAGSGSSSDYRRRGGGASTAVNVRTDYQTNQLMVFAPPEKFPIIEQIVRQLEGLAEEAAQHALDTGMSGTVISTGRDAVTKLYKVNGPAKEIATVLDKALYELWGWDAPYVKPFTFTNEVIVEGDPKHFAQVEKFLQEIEKNPPQPKIMLAARRVKDPQKVLEQVQRFASTQDINIRPIARPGGLRSPLEMLEDREIRYYDPITQPSPAPQQISEQEGASPFVPPVSELAQMQAAISAINMAQVETRPADAGGPAASGTAATTRPAADAPEEQPADQRSAAQALLDSFVEEGTAVPPADNGGPAARGTAGGTPTERPLSPEERMYVELNQAAGAAKESEEVQVRYDAEQGLIFIVGQESQVKDFNFLLDTIIEELDNIEDVTKTEFRVVKVEHVAVEVAAVILEQMFNETVQPQQQRQQPARRPRTAQQRQSGEQESDEEGGSRRREEEEEQKKREEAEAQAAAQAAGQRIKVIPDPRTGTLIIRAAPETFPVIADLLLKIDRPGHGAGVQIKIFQLEKLNAGEVEQAIKAILKIDDGTRRTLRPRTTRGSRGGGAEADLIERLQEEMLELQMQQEQAAAEAATSQQPGTNGVQSRLKLNPAKDIGITSDATTNTIIVQAPREGIELVESLINQLEEQEIPLEIRSFRVEHGDAEKVAAGLQSVFAADRGAARGRGGDGVMPSRVGDVRISAFSRTSTIVVRALKPDMDKIEPLVKELDVAPEEQQVQIYAVQAGNAADMANTLRGLFVEPGETGPRAVRIQADAETNSILVYAPNEARQLMIAAKIKELDEKMTESAMAKQVELKFANASSVATKLTEIFVPRSRRNVRGAQRVEITGDDNSGILFVVAPDEIFKQIQKVAMDLDRPSKQDVQIFPLKHAAATDVEGQFKQLMIQMSAQMRAGGAAEAFGVTPDARTNSLIVIGSPATLLMVDTVLKKLDVPPTDDTAETVAMYPITGGGASSVASSINSLYRDQKFPGGVQPPRAVAAGNDMVYVYGTGQQIQQVKALIIEPMEAYRKPQITAVQRSEFVVEHANADEVAEKLKAWFKSRNDALKAAGTTPPPSESVMEIMPDNMTKRLFVQCSEANKKQIEELLTIFDTPEVSDAGLQYKVIPVQYADVTYAYQAISAVFARSDRPVNERPVITPEYGTRSLVVKAIPDDMARIEELLADIDRDEVGKLIPPETVQIENVKASEVAAQVSAYISQTRRPDTRTRQYPVSVVGRDSTNTIVITAQKESDLAEIKTLIAKLDSRPAGDQREVLPYVLKYADIGATMQAINANFAANAQRPVRDQVSALPDYTTSSLLITASPENHERVAKIVEQLDKSNIGIQRTTETVKVNNLRATVLADRLNAHIRQTMRVDRRIGTYPVSVTGDDGSNSIMVNANPEHMADMKALIEKLDVKSEDFDDRIVKPYAVQYADLSAVQQAVVGRFPPNASKTSRDLVTVGLDWTNSTVIVTASPENQETVAELIENLDRLDLAGRRETRPIALEKARAGDVATTLTSIIRDSAARRRTPAPSVQANEATNTVLVTSTEKEFQDLENLVKQVLDVEPSADAGLQYKVIPVKNADVTYAYQAISQVFGRSTRPVNERPVIMPEYGSGSLVVKAVPEDLDRIEELLADMDREGAGDLIPPETVQIEHVKASEVAAQVSAYISQTRRPDTRTRQYPVSVTGRDSTNTVVITAQKKGDLDEIKTLIAKLDSRPAGEQRETHSYVLKYADIGATVQAINANFAANAQRSVKEQVSAFPDYATGSVLVTASAENHESVARIVEQLDSPQSQESLPKPLAIPIKNMRATRLASQLGQLIPSMYRIDRRTSRYPVSVTGDDSTNTLLVTANDEHMEQMQKLIAEMDALGEDADDRTVQPYALQYADLTAVDQALRARFPAHTSRNNRDLVGVSVDYSSSTVIVTASPENQKIVSEMIEELDRLDNAGRRETRSIALQKARVGEVADTLTATLRASATQRRTPAPSVQPDEATNTLLVTSTQKEFEDIEKLVTEILDVEPGADAERTLKVYNIKFADLNAVLSGINSAFRSTGRRASFAETVNAVAEPGTYSAIVMANAENHEKIARLIEELDQPGSASHRQTHTIEIQHADPEDVMNTLNDIYTSAARGRRDSRGPAVFNVMQGTRKLLVTATAAEMEQIQEVIDQLDVPESAGARDMRVVALSRIAPQEMAQVLTEYLRRPGSRGRSTDLLGDVRVVASVGANSVVLTGPPDRLVELENLVTKIDQEAEDKDMGRQVVVIPLTNADSASVASVINSNFAKRGTVSEADLVRATAERTTNTVVVTAAPANLERVQTMIKELDENSSNTPKQEIVSLKHARAADMVEVLTQTYRSSRRSSGGPQIAFAADTNSNAVVVSAGDADLTAIREMIEQLDRPATDQLQEMRVMPLQHIDATETATFLTEHFRRPGGTARRRGSSDELIGDIRIQASALMNALIVSGSTEELDQIQSMIQEMDKDVAGAGAPKIIQLEHAACTQLAQTLTQMFTDPARQARGRNSPETIPLIVADEMSGSLLVRARGVDYNLIEDMVQQLDVPSDNGQIKVIRISRGRDVAALAKMIQDTVNNAEIAKQQLQRSYRGGRVSIGYDERVPALIVAGTPDLFKQVETLVADLDGMHPNGAPRTVIVPLKGDPNRVKVILDQVIERQTGIKQK